MGFLESKGQQRLCNRLRADGWLVIKITVCSLTGFPDLMIMRHPGEIKFIECKTSKGVRNGKQKIVGEKLEKLGFTVELWNVETMERIFDKPLEIRKELF